MSIRLIIEDSIIAEIGDLPINIILSYLSKYEICTYSEIPDDWKFISLLGTGSDYKFYKLMLYEYDIELWFGSYDISRSIPGQTNYFNFQLAIQSSLFKYTKYYNRTILNGYEDNADGLQEYINNELGIFINHYYIRFLYSFIESHLSKFNTITQYFSYLRNTDSFCQICKEIFEESHRCECEIHIEDQNISSSESDDDDDDDNDDDNDDDDDDDDNYYSSSDY